MSHFCNHQYDLQLEHSFIARASYADYPVWRIKNSSDDPRLAFAKEYDDMAGLFRKQHKLVPVSFADGLTLMFSDNDWERAFMVHMWELLKIYSVEDLDSPKTDLMEVPGIPDRYVFDPSSDYPLRYTNRGGPVPIQMQSDMIRLTGLIAAKALCVKDQDYRWTVDQYLYSILAMRVMAVQPQFHDGYSFDSKPGESLHAHCDSSREMVTCAQLLPSIFTTQNDVGSDKAIFDEHQVDCGDCDISTVVKRFIAFNTICWSEQMRDEYYLDTEDVGNQVETLIKQRVPYEDFWRVLANDYNDSIASKEGRYWARSWDTGNWWSMLKRNALDKKADLQGYYSKAKAVKISEEADQFLKQRADILPKPKKTQDRPGEVRPLDLSYLNVGGTDQNQSSTKQQEITVHASHLSDDYPKIGAHVATPLSHLGPGMKDEDLFVPPSVNYHALFREDRRNDSDCHGVRLPTHHPVLRSCQEIDDTTDHAESKDCWLKPSYRTTGARRKRSAPSGTDSVDEAESSTGTAKGKKVKTT